ncbi:MAG: hypothetical protein ACPG47_03250 [Leucothrix sp.]
MWLQQEGATINKALIKQKLKDYKIDGFVALLDARINSIESIVHGLDFDNEMRRFLSQEAYDRTLGKNKFREFLVSNLVGLLTSAKNSLSTTANNETDFRL